MPYADYQKLLPSAGAFANPQDFQSFLQAQALQKSSYLSSMDQFYAQLDETSRQFNESLGIQKGKLSLEEKYFGLEEKKFDWEKEKFGEEFVFDKEKFAQDIGLRKTELEQTKEYQTGTLELGKERLEIEEKGTGGMQFIGPTFAEQEQMDFLRDVWRDTQAQKTGAAPSSGQVTAPQGTYVGTYEHKKKAPKPNLPYEYIE